MLVDEKLLDCAEGTRTGHEPVHVHVLAPTDQQNIVHRSHVTSIPQALNETPAHLYVRQIVQADPVRSDYFPDDVYFRLDRDQQNVI